VYQFLALRQPVLGGFSDLSVTLEKKERKNPVPETSSLPMSVQLINDEEN